MSILSTVKKGYMTIKTASGYVKLLPRTLATLVAMSDGKSVEEKINELNGKLLRARNTSQTGWTFNRMGNLVFFSHNKVVGGVVANTKYTNQGNAPAGYKPVAKYYANGIRMVGSVINGSFYFEILPDGSTVFESTANHTNDQSYVVSGCYITDDTFPTADKL